MQVMALRLWLRGTTQHDAARIADCRCASSVPRSKDRPSLRWVMSHCCRESDVVLALERVRCRCVAVTTLRYRQGVPGRVRRCCPASRRRVARAACLRMTARRPTLDGVRILIEWISRDAAGYGMSASEPVLHDAFSSCLLPSATLRKEAVCVDRECSGSRIGMGSKGG